MKNVINFSGGKSSALMTILVYKPGDIVLFCDTGREHAKTYKFINDFEAHEEIPVTRISLNDSKQPFTELIQKKKYKALPNRVRRFCTVELKVKVARRYLVKQKIRAYNNFIGFRVDEPKRVKNRKKYWKTVDNKYPLYEKGITKQMVNEYWKNKPYNLEIPSILGNCTLCFNKGKNAILAILATYPELANEWIADETESEKLYGKGNGRTYLPGTTIQQLKEYAQNNLFSQYNLENVDPAFNCACTS